MPIDVFFDERVLDHDTGSGVFDAPDEDALVAAPEPHPEGAQRIRNMRAMLERGPLGDRLRWRPGRLAAREELERVHDPAYLDSLRAACEAGPGRITNSTPVGPRSWEPILAAAGTCLEAADAVISDRAPIAYALVRPPGHHAQPDRADGYCFVNHAGLVADAARRAGIARVAIVDWDVHHGNGAQQCFWGRGDVLTVSLHMRTGLWSEAHQQAGGPGELGVGDGFGRNVNVELPPGSGDRAYVACIERVVAPVVRQFGPGLIVGACGQDASAFDPNGRQNVSMEGFRRIGAAIRGLADELCGGRLALVQEGGYAPTYAAYCLHATLEGVAGVAEPLLPDPLAYVPDHVALAREAVDSAQSALSNVWTF